MDTELTWRVTQNTGKRATLARGDVKKEIHRPANMTLKEFVTVLPHKSTVSDQDLKLKFPTEAAEKENRQAASKESGEAPIQKIHESSDKEKEIRDGEAA